MLFKIKQLPLLLFALLLVFAVSIASAAEDHESPEEHLQVCLKVCDQYAHPVKVEGCVKQCQQKYAEEREGDHGVTGDKQQEKEEHQGEQEENPYVFQDQHFSTPFKTQHGTVRMLQRFTERSELLRGIEDYRVFIVEAEPQTFIVPNHWDAEIIFFVAKGRGSVSLIRADKRESFNIRRGDIVRIPSGSTTYLINRDDKERLVLAKLIQPVSTHARSESFFGAGAENPESYYKVFSNDILVAALNTRMDKLEKLLGAQKQGVIIKASEMQIKALSENEESSKSESTINIFQESPLQENRYGKLHLVRPEDHQKLQHLNIGVSYLNITQGAMSAPMYNSKATRIAIALKGEGYFEMACPDLSSQSESKGSEQGKGGIRYNKVSARVRVGTVLVIPAGHPFVTVASNNQNLELVCFEVNARHNDKIPLAGKKNVVNYFHREAKELAFGVPSREVDEVFGSQQQEYFFKGPREQHQGQADE